MLNQALIASVSAKARADARLPRLIAEYQRLASEAVEAMKRAYNRADLLRAWRTGAIKKSGKLAKRHIGYEFHGAGCRFQVAKQIVDVDFGPKGQHDGFDAWRLWLLADSSSGYADLDLPAIERGLAALEARRIIKKIGHGDRECLYHLTKVKSAAIAG
ncbi:MAG TPA: hypothetical protein VH370_05655 [Humisphaera sp.]|jgi:hypothetical protein|nr:hypothetical protein [Humisphaera sp.]